MMPISQHTIVDDGVTTRSRLFLPVHPIAAVESIVNGKGETIPPAWYLVDRQLGIVRYAGNMDFTEHPYTVTVRSS